MKEVRTPPLNLDAKHFGEEEHDFTEDEREKLWKHTWYHDVWLNKASVYAKFGATVRFYEKATAKNSEGRPHVTTQTEAFAELVRNNCESKWNAVFNLRKNDDKTGKTKIPKYKKDDKSTHQYHATKWTDPRAGPKKGGGWKGSWASVWAATVKDFRAFRAEDKRNGELFYHFGLKLVRHTNHVSHVTYRESRKRKRNNVDEEVIEDDVDDCGDDFEDSDIEE